MDRVRFGRVLGRGARLAARTVYEAVDAATSAPPDAAGPSGTAQPAQPARRSQPRYPSVQVQQPASRPTVRAQPARERSWSRQSVLAPVKRASRAVSLEITGSFFALFAFAFGVAAWRSRMAVAGADPSFSRTFVYCAVALLFAYFAASNFVRAKRL